MSKYTDLCEAVGQARQTWYKFRDGCLKDTVALVEGFAKYCEIPRENIFFSPLDKEPTERTNYMIPGAMHFGEDGFWHLGLGLIFSGQRVLLEICVSQRKGKTIVKLGTDGQHRELDLTQEGQRNAFYDEIIGKLNNYFVAEALDALDGTSTKKIGFHS
jgi:hypothetical protein